MDKSKIHLNVMGDKLNNLHYALHILPYDTFEFKDSKNNQLEALLYNGVCQVFPSLGVIAKAKVPKGAINITEKFGHIYFRHMNVDYCIFSREKI